MTAEAHLLCCACGTQLAHFTVINSGVFLFGTQLDTHQTTLLALSMSWVSVTQATRQELDP